MGIYGAGILALARMVVDTSPSFNPRPEWITQPVERPEENEEILKPGCTAADEALTVYGHLRGLSQGWGGFGLLRESKKRLERAADAAKIAGSREVEEGFKKIASELPSVQSPEAAERAMNELDPLLPKAWELAKRCGISGRLWEHARELADKVHAGGMSREEAISDLKRAGGL